MHATEKITLTLPAEAIEIARARVVSGEFESESDVITQALLESVLPLLDSSEPSDAFLAECARRYDRMREDPSRALTLEQAFEGLDT